MTDPDPTPPVTVIGTRDERVVQAQHDGRAVQLTFVRFDADVDPGGRPWMLRSLLTTPSDGPADQVAMWRRGSGATWEPAHPTTDPVPPVLAQWAEDQLARVRAGRAADVG